MPFVIGGAATLRILNDRQLMFRTDKVTQPCHGSVRSAEVSELLCAIKRDGVPIDMIVDVGFVGMSADKESVFSFEKAGGEIIADLVCFLRRDFARFERLANLVNEHIILFVLAGKGFVLTF